MVQKTRLATLLALSGALALSGVAHAQSYGAPSGPPTGAPGSTAPIGAPGSSTTTTTTTPGAVNNQLSDGTTITTSTSELSTDESTLPATGGEPWLMAFGGLALAAGALTLRRRIS